MSSTIPKAVIFDLGKVLLDFDYGRTARALVPQSRVDEATFRRALDQSDLLLRFETGHLSSAEMFTEVVRITGYRGDFASFAEAFGDIFTEIPSMIALQAQLRTLGLPTYIFSNTNGLAVDFIRRRFPFFHNFTGYIYSHEVRCMKPQATIYEAVEKLSGQRGDELLYIDDREENVRAGAARGWQVIHHHTPAETIHTVHSRIAPILPS